MSKPKTAQKPNSASRTSNVTFRCHPTDKDAIVRAAAKAGKTDSEYCRDVMIDYAYSDLGERRPNLPPVGRDVRKRMIEEAAKARGMTARKYMLELAQQQAALDLGFDTATPPAQKRPLVSPAPLQRFVPAVRKRPKRS